MSKLPGDDFRPVAPLSQRMMTGVTSKQMVTGMTIFFGLMAEVIVSPMPGSPLSKRRLTHAGRESS